MTTGAASACPSCGAPLHFGGGQSLAAICSYCRSAVARDGANLSLIGKVPDLVATDTRLAIGVTGRVDNRPYIVIGHLQLGHLGETEAEGGGVAATRSIDATWDEWYVSHPDGSWGWLAEAQGHLYYTRHVGTAKNLPRWQSLYAGKRISLDVGEVAIDELNEAVFASAEGELPFRPDLGATYAFADASTDSGGFVTLDYGAEGDEPMLFAGRQLEYTDAGIPDRAPVQAVGREAAHALSCPNCGGPLSLKLKDSESVTCPSCHSLLDVSRGSAQLIAAMQKRLKPDLPLGSKGVLFGEKLEVLGFVRRQVTVDEVDYTWDEYLLHGSGGYRWLSCSAGHWTFLWPIPAGKVKDAVDGVSALCDGRRFKHFQSANATYLEIQGEFYWKVDIAKTVYTQDYVAPPYMLSCEQEKKEINWSRGEYLNAVDVWAAFHLPGDPPAQTGVGAAQPNPYSARMGKVWGVAGLTLLALLLGSLVFAAKPKQELLSLSVPLGTSPNPLVPAPPGPPPVTLSEPFEITGSRPQAVEISALAEVNQAWVGLDVALIEDETGESHALGFELSHYHGVDDGESWSEGNHEGSATVGGVHPGKYVLRVEPQLEKTSAGTVGSHAQVKVEQGAFLAAPLLLALFLVMIYPLGLTVLTSMFEKRRWAESDHGE